MDVHGARFDESVAAPHDVEQLLPSEHPPGGAGQGREELELLGRELDRPALHPHLEAMAIDLQITDLEAGLLLLGVGLPPAPEDRADPGDQLARREGLGHIVVGAHFEAEDLVPLLDASAHHDHGDRGQLGVLLDAPADLPAVELRDHDVEQHHVGAVLPGEPERLVPIAGQDDVVAFLREVVADQLGHILLVLHEKHLAETLAARLACPRRDRASVRGHHVGLPCDAHPAEVSPGRATGR